MCSCTQHSLKELQIWKKLQQKERESMKQQSYKQIFHLYSQCLTSLNE